MKLEIDEETSTLRKKLQEMVQSGPDLRAHRTALQAIASDIPNTIRIVDTDLTEDRYRCGMHAFGIERNELYGEIVNRLFGIINAGNDFFSWLLGERLLDEISDVDANEGDLVMYFSQGSYVHVGRMATPNRVISKWGLGFLYEHRLSEVPQQYGEEVQFFRNPGPDASMDLFVRYALQRAIEFDWDLFRNIASLAHR